jgi:hypothetical protein
LTCVAQLLNILYKQKPYDRPDNPRRIALP